MAPKNLIGFVGPFIMAVIPELKCNMFYILTIIVRGDIVTTIVVTISPLTKYIYKFHVLKGEQNNNDRKFFN